MGDHPGAYCSGLGGDEGAWAKIDVLGCTQMHTFKELLTGLTDGVNVRCKGRRETKEVSRLWPP